MTLIVNNNTLGSKLRLIVDKLREQERDQRYNQKLAGLLESQAIIRQRNLERKEARNQLKSFFCRLQEEVEIAVANGTRVKEIHVPENSINSFRPFGSAHDFINSSFINPKNEFHQTWVEFSDWLDKNDLKVKFTYEHDGIGTKSWTTATVEPK